MSDTPSGTTARAGGGDPRRALRQTAWITAAAVLAYAGIRSLPVDGGTLHYDDFGAAGRGGLEFCEPGGPQFVPVDRVRSPVSLALRVEGGEPPRRGETARLTAVLTAASGKPVTADDLLVVHTRRLHLLVVDPSLADYQHLHPEPAGAPGEFTFAFTPRGAGAYRVFADFTPRVTGRALYAGARLEVAGEPVAPAAVASSAALVAEAGGLQFSLAADREVLRINETAELRLAVVRLDGGPVQLEPIMGAPAHLVAFDAGRTGFAHLHPLPADAPGGAVPAGGDDPLRFQLSLSDPGTYRLWAQVQVDGREIFAPFDLHVRP